MCKHAAAVSATVKYNCMDGPIVLTVGVEPFHHRQQIVCKPNATALPDLIFHFLTHLLKVL